METIELNGETYVKQSEQLAPCIDGMAYCIIRCTSAGVHAGYVAAKTDATVTLVQSRRLWLWWGKTLSGLATEGSFAPEKCKYADEIPEITLNGWCEIIPCTAVAVKSVREDVRAWVND